jgi:hypothetical protein
MHDRSDVLCITTSAVQHRESHEMAALEVNETLEPLFQPDGVAGPEVWHPKLKRLYDYWLSIHPRAGLPGRQHLDPTAIPDLLPYLFMVDVERNPLRFKYRLVGTEYVHMMGHDLTGRYLDEVHPGFPGPIRDQYVEIAEHGQFAYRKGRAMFEAARHDYFLVERVALPMARNGVDVDMILGAIIHLRLT